MAFVEPEVVHQVGGNFFVKVGSGRVPGILVKPVLSLTKANQSPPENDLTRPVAPEEHGGFLRLPF